MAICNSVCAPALPLSYAAGCGIVSRAGGIKFLVFIKCDYEFTDIGSRVEWEAAVASNDVVISGLVLGQKPKGSFTKKRVASCQPEAVVGAEKTLTFQDYNTDTVTVGEGGCLAYSFWNTILQEPSSYKFGYYSCDGRFYGVINDFQIEVDEVIEDNNTGSIYFDGTISWNQVQMLCPEVVDLNGL
jgi:hypothetical protein